MTASQPLRIMATPVSIRTTVGKMVYDFCINGGGMVGAALALGLAQQGYQVALVESEQTGTFDAQQPPDMRVSALSMGTVQLLSTLGVWDDIHKMRARAYEQLSVWEHPANAIHFSAHELNLTQLGYFVENRLLPMVCHKALAAMENVRVDCPHVLHHMQRTEMGWRLLLDNGEEYECRWLIGADGARSRVRQAAQIGTEGWQYKQRALAISIRASEAFPATTWQQFYATGPRALLPLHDNFACLVWYDQPATIQKLRVLSPAQLRQQVLDQFPPLPPVFEVVDTADFTLTRSHAQRYVAKHCLLIGDAAHTINPLAGQGVNLGFKDIKTLLDVTRQCRSLDDDAFERALRHDYERPRRIDNLLMMSAMDACYWGFSQDSTPIAWLRKAAMKVLSQGVPFKRHVLAYAIGLS